jgi:hypothetical protein
MILEEKLKQLQEKIKQNPLTGATILIVVLLLLLIVIPYLQVDYRGINNATQEATLENQYRATFAQILGGVAIGIGLYYTWRRVTIAENDLKVSQEGQITERFTRAVDQLGAIDQFGNKALEIRLGGIYALERISNESEKDYWPIMEILTAYIRKNSSIEDEKVKNQTNLSLDVQAVLTVIRRRKCSIRSEEITSLNLQRTNIRQSDLVGADLSQADLSEANLSEANLYGADLPEANLSSANLSEANLSCANLSCANLSEANFSGADLSFANLYWVDLKGALNLTVDQLSKVKTLRHAELDEELERPLREKYPALFEKPQR